MRGRERGSAPARTVTDQEPESKKTSANLVQGDEHPDQELLVLGLEGEGEPVDNAPQDLQQLAHPVKVLRLVNKPKQPQLETILHQFN